MSHDDIARQLLLRDRIEVTLNLGAEQARDLPDEVLIRVLGREALRIVRDVDED